MDPNGYPRKQSIWVEITISVMITEASDGGEEPAWNVKVTAGDPDRVMQTSRVRRTTFDPSSLDTDLNSRERSLKRSRER